MRTFLLVLVMGTGRPAMDTGHIIDMVGAVLRLSTLYTAALPLKEPFFQSSLLCFMGEKERIYM